LRNHRRAEQWEFADLSVRGAGQSRAVNKRVLESLAAAGAFDTFEKNCARVLPQSVVLARAQRATSSCDGPKRAIRWQYDPRTIALPQVEPWLPADRFA
jgi:DNA polymerase-3 subunit alpha